MQTPDCAAIAAQLAAAATAASRSIAPSRTAMNLASRIESLNKEFGSQILISDAVHQNIGNVANAASLGDVPIRGYEQPVRIWRLA